MYAIIFSLLITLMTSHIKAEPPFLEPGHSLLREKIELVPPQEITSPEVQAIIDEMFAVADVQRTEKRGLLGLAAPQIGINKAIILVDTGFNDSTKEYGQLEVFINPTVIWQSSEQQERREGCFSVDSRLTGIVIRPKLVEIAAFNRKGELLMRQFADITARIVQHEIDHLEGIRFPDRIGEKGTLHWVEENLLDTYMVNWRNWPIICPWALWTAMKEGDKEFQHFLILTPTP